MLKKFTALVALLAAMSVLAACGTNDDASQQETQTAANGDTFNDADVAFATDMIQHHAQALSMVDLTMGRRLDPEVQQLAEDIREAQGPEIEQMTGWLTDWDQPIPETVRDHANAHGDGEMEMDSDMPGMMSSEEMSDLEASRRRAVPADVARDDARAPRWRDRDGPDRAVRGQPLGCPRSGRDDRVGTAGGDLEDGEPARILTTRNYERSGPSRGSGSSRSLARSHGGGGGI